MIRPLRSNVTVIRKESEGVSAGGIIIPDEAREVLEEGEVVAVGKGKDGKPLQVKIGDSVLFSKNGLHKSTQNGTTYIVMSEASIHGIRRTK